MGKGNNANSPLASISSPKWAVLGPPQEFLSQPVLPAAIPCHQTMLLSQLQFGCADQKGWSYLPKGGSPKHLLCAAQQKRWQVYSPCITARGTSVSACVCLSMSGCTFTNTCSLRPSQFKKCQSLLWLQVPVHLPQLLEASLEHFFLKIVFNTEYFLVFVRKMDPQTTCT